MCIGRLYILYIYVCPAPMGTCDPPTPFHDIPPHIHSTTSLVLLTSMLNGNWSSCKRSLARECIFYINARAARCCCSVCWRIMRACCWEGRASERARVAWEYTSMYRTTRGRDNWLVFCLAKSFVTAAREFFNWLGNFSIPDFSFYYLYRCIQRHALCRGIILFFFFPRFFFIL